MLACAIIAPRYCDKSGDGIFSAEEFLDALESNGIAVGHEIDRARANKTQDEAARILAHFDRDGNGQLAYNEFKRLLQGSFRQALAGLPEHCGPGPAVPSAINGWSSGGAQLGSCLPGTASEVAEHVIANADACRAESEVLRRLQSVFRQWDLDGDGVISERDLREVLLELNPQFSQSQTKRMFAAADGNRDGLIDYNKFIAWLFK